MLEKLLKHNFASKLLHNYKVKMSLVTWITSKSHYYERPYHFVIVYSYTFDKRYNGVLCFNNNNIIKKLSCDTDFKYSFALLKR